VYSVIILFYKTKMHIAGRMRARQNCETTTPVVTATPVTVTATADPGSNGLNPTDDGWSGSRDLVNKYNHVTRWLWIQ
jgi:hypothetical protein